jgi:hypothetical protein
MTINILGTDYEVIKRKFDDDPDFHKNEIDGYCDAVLHQIVYCDMTTYPQWQDESQERCTLQEKAILRHEIVHAFFNESGLQSSTLIVESPWSQNEEMVDWFALQGPKVYEAWKNADAL